MPTPSSSLRRIALTNNTAESTPVRKQSGLQLTEPSNAILENLNDESERSARRSNVDLQRRVSNIPPPSDSLNDSFKFGCEQEMKDHFQICSKLFNENKINAKNVWKLQIIDLMKQLSQKTSGDNLVLASTSLDISAKVYGIRVDDVHMECIKLASNMARAAEKESPVNEDEENPEGDEDGPPKKKKKKTRRFSLTNKNSIAKEPNIQLAPLPKLESVFFSTRTSADASAVDNLVTNVLKVDNSGYRFVLLSDEKAWPEKDVVNTNQGTKTYQIAVPSVSNLQICAPFSDFILDEWDPTEEEKQFDSESSFQRCNEVLYDEEGIPIPELDGSIHDIFSNNDNDNDMDIEEEIEVQEFNVQSNDNIARIVDCIPAEANQRSEYSYNNIISNYSGQIIDQIWAGPSHWKLKFIKRASSRFTGQVTHEKLEKQAKKRAVVEPLDFTGPVMEVSKLVSKKKMPLADVNKISLPLPDAYCANSLDFLTELLTKPSVKIQAEPEENKPNVDYEFKSYNYENPNDSQYCAQNNDNDCDVNDNEGDFEEHIVAQEPFLGENLVDAPEAVPKSSVGYALQAKKMDMKKLKASVWEKLIKTDDNPTNELDQNNKTITTSFSKLFTELPSSLTEKMRKELSCPLAFIALLHLCNENNLFLRQLPGYKDFTIEGSF